MSSVLVRAVTRIALSLSGIFFLANHLLAQEAPGTLSVTRIYSQPSLSGKLIRGVQWSPDGKLISFFETRGEEKDTKTELWGMEAANGTRRLLVSADKLETVLPQEKAKSNQATGLSRHAASQYQWAPSGAAILFVGTNSLGWLELKSQTS